MPETKADITQLFKKGEKFECRETDYSAQKKSDEIQHLKDYRDEVRRSADVDLTKLKTMIFKI